MGFGIILNLHFAIIPLNNLMCFAHSYGITEAVCMGKNSTCEVKCEKNSGSFSGHNDCNATTYCVCIKSGTRNLT